MPWLLAIKGSHSSLPTNDAFGNATQGNAGQLLYNTTALRCSDNLNDGIRRLSRTIQQLSMTTFFGSIGFNKQGQNYAGSISLAQVRGSPWLLFIGQPRYCKGYCLGQLTCSPLVTVDVSCRCFP